METLIFVFLFVVAVLFAIEQRSNFNEMYKKLSKEKRKNIFLEKALKEQKAKNKELNKEIEILKNKNIIDAKIVESDEEFVFTDKDYNEKVMKEYIERLKNNFDKFEDLKGE